MKYYPVIYMDDNMIGMIIYREIIIFRGLSIMDLGDEILLRCNIGLRKRNILKKSHASA